MTHQRRRGVRSKRPNRMALGGHSVEIGWGRMVSAMPSSAANTYATPARTAVRTVRYRPEPAGTMTEEDSSAAIEVTIADLSERREGGRPRRGAPPGDNLRWAPAPPPPRSQNPLARPPPGTPPPPPSLPPP